MYQYLGRSADLRVSSRCSPPCSDREHHIYWSEHAWSLHNASARCSLFGNRSRVEGRELPWAALRYFGSLLHGSRKRSIPNVTVTDSSQFSFKAPHRRLYPPSLELFRESSSSPPSCNSTPVLKHSWENFKSPHTVYCAGAPALTSYLRHPRCIRQYSPCVC